MALENIRPTRRIPDQPRDKPQVDRVEHANLDSRPGATLHPHARRSAAPGAGWDHYAKSPVWH